MFFADKSEEFEILNASAFQTPLNHSYSCLVQEELKNANVTIKMSDVRMEAFMGRTPGHREFSAGTIFQKFSEELTKVWLEMSF